MNIQEFSKKFAEATKDMTQAEKDALMKMLRRN